MESRECMSDKTGMCKGSLRPILYAEAPNGWVELLPKQEGHDDSLPRKMYETKYKPRGWEYREAGSWPEWKRLQERLVAQERQNAETIKQQRMSSYDVAKAKTAAEMRQRMTSSDCTPYERDFIQHWLLLSEEKRKKYEALWEQHQSYLWAVEMNPGTHFADRMKGENAV